MLIMAELNLFYYFVEAQSADHLSLPLTLWPNGGSEIFNYVSCQCYDIKV